MDQMALVNCIRCGNVFAPERDTNVCPECVAKENVDLKKVTEYLRDYPLANAMEVSDRTGVSAVQIFRFVKQGSLILSDPTEAYKCRMCGKDVKKGTLCQDCLDKVKDLKEAIEKKKKRDHEKKRKELKKNTRFK
jgi:DNA-directed RNA polymerase subunit RPC12/RpoP